MAERNLHEGMVAIVQGRNDGLSVTLTDQRHIGAVNPRGGATRPGRGAMGTTSFGVQTCTAERSLSGTQIVRATPVSAYHQHTFASAMSLSPPTSPTRRTTNTVDIQRLKDQLDELRDSLYTDDGQGWSKMPRHHSPNAHEAPIRPQTTSRPTTAHFRPPSPKYRPTSPQYRPPSPQYRPPSPQYRPPNPTFRPPSPLNRPLSPLNRSPSPLNRAPIPPNRPQPTTSFNPASPMELPTRQSQIMPVRDGTWFRYNQNGIAFERGSNEICSERDLWTSDAFTGSLRKYPNADRTASADLIERLLAYAQSKHGPKICVYKKRGRSLTRHSREFNGSRGKKSSNKTIQTYTRSPGPVRDTASKYGKPERRQRVISPEISEKSDGSPHPEETTSYDYLKIGKFCQATDVRYLTDMSRLVRDYLRSYHNNDALCPEMLQRYLDHRREHHVVEAATLTGEHTEEPRLAPSNYNCPIYSRMVNTSFLKKGQVRSTVRKPLRYAGRHTTVEVFSATSSAPNRPKRSCRFIKSANSIDCKRRGKCSKNITDSISMKMIEIKEKLCMVCNQSKSCTCNLPPPCQCPENSRRTYKNRLKSIDLCDEIKRFCTQKPIYEACTCPEDIDEMVDKTVNQWLKSVPIYAGFTYDDGVKCENMIRNLKNNLKQHIGERDVSKDDIYKFLKQFPMWLPPDTTEHDEFKDKLAEDLVTLMRNIDIFGNRVKLWVEALPIDIDADVSITEITKTFTKKLKDLAMTTNNLRDDTKQAAYAELDILPISGCICSNDIEEITDKLVYAISSLPQQIIDGLKYLDEYSAIRQQLGFSEKIRAWENSIPIETLANVDREAITPQLEKKLADLMLNADAEVLRDSIKVTIQKTLEKLPVQGGRPEINIQSSKLTEDLAIDMFETIVYRWAKTVAFDHNANVNPEVFGHSLTKKLMDGIGHLEPYEAEDTMKDIIFNELDTYPASGSTALKASKVDELANALCKLGSNIGKIKEIVKDWIVNVPFVEDPRVNIPKIINSLAKDIKHKIDSLVPEDVKLAIKQKVQDKLDKLPVACDNAVKEIHAENLADAIVQSIFDEAIFGWVKTLPFKLDAPANPQTFANDFTKKVNDIVAYEDPDKILEALRAQAIEILNDNLIATNDEQNLIDDFVKTVTNLPKPRDKVTYEVDKWYETKIPTNAPVDKEKNTHLVHKLKNKLKSTISEEAWNSVKEVAYEELEQLDLNCLPSEIEDLAEDLANCLIGDKFLETVTKWAKNIKLDSVTGTDVKITAAELAKHLKDGLGHDDISEAHDNLKNIIIESLNKVPGQMDSEEKDQEAENLLISLEKSKKKVNKLLIPIEKWMKVVPFKADVPVNKIKVMKDLEKKMENILNSAAPDDMWLEMKEAANEKVLSLPINGEVATMENLSENLANLFASNMLVDTVKNSIKDAPFGLNDKPVERNQLVNYLTKEIGAAIATTDPEHLDDHLKEIIDAMIGKQQFPCTTAQKKEFATELIKKINILPKPVDKFSQTVRNWTKTFPFATNPPVNKKKFALDLTKKLNRTVSSKEPEIARDAIKDEIIDTLKNYKSTCDEIEQNKLVDTVADQLVFDVFSDTVRKWTYSIPLKPSPDVNLDEVKQRLTDKLRPKFHPENIDRADIMNTICSNLISLPIECAPSDKNSLSKDLATKLINKLIKLPPEETEERKRKRLRRPTFAVNVGDWLKGAAVSLGAAENEKVVKSAIDKLRQMREEGKDEKYIKAELKKDIEDKVKSLLVGKGENPVAVQNCANKLYNQVSEMLTTITKERKKEILPKLQKSIKLWLLDNPEIGIGKNKHEEIIKELSEKIANEAMGSGTETHIKNQIIQAIRSIYKQDHIVNKGSKLRNDPDLQNKMTDILIKKITVDMDFIATNVEKKDKQDNLYRVQAVQIESKMSLAEKRKLKKRIKSFAQRLSSFSAGSPSDEQVILDDKTSKSTHEFDKNTDKKLFTKNKGTVADDLLRSLELETDFSEEICETMPISSETTAKIKINKGTDNIRQLPYKNNLDHQKHQKLTDEKTNVVPKVILRNTNNRENLNNRNNIVLKRKSTTGYKSPHKDTAKQLPEQLAHDFSTLFELIQRDNLNNAKKDENNRLYNIPNISDNISANKLTNLQFVIEDELGDCCNIDTDLKNKLVTKLLGIFKTIDLTSPTSSKKLKYNVINGSEEDLKKWTHKISVFKNNKSNQENIKKSTNCVDKSKLTIVETDSLESDIIDISSFSSTSHLKKTIATDVTSRIECIPKLSNSTSCSRKKIETLTETLINKLANTGIHDSNERLTGKHIQTETMKKESDILEYRGDLNTQIELMSTSQPDRSTESVTFDKNTDNNKKQVNSPKVIKQKIRNWIKLIPDIAYCTCKEKRRIHKICCALVNRLSKIETHFKDDKEAQSKIMNEIKDKLDSISKITGQQIDTITKHNLSNQLLGQLIKPVTTACSCTSFYKVHENTHEVETNTEDCVDKLLKSISTASPKALEEINIFKTMTENLVENLDSIIQCQGLDASEFKKEMFSKFTDKLFTVCDKSTSNINTKVNPNAWNKFSDKLVSTSMENEKYRKSTQELAINAPQSAVLYNFSSNENLMKKLGKNFKEHVTDNREHILEVKTSTINENKKSAREISMRNAAFQTTEQDYFDIRKEKQNEIIEKINNVFDKRSKELDKKTKQKLLAKILPKAINSADDIESLTNQECEDRSQLSNVHNKGDNIITSKSAATFKEKDNEEISDEISTTKAFHSCIKTWFNGISELQATTSTERMKNKKVLRNLARSLKNLRSQNLKSSELRNKIISEIKRKLDLISKNKIVNFDSKTKDNLAIQLFDQIMDNSESSCDSEIFLSRKVTSAENPQKMFKEILLGLVSNNPYKKELEQISEDLLKVLNTSQPVSFENHPTRNKKILTNIKDQLDIVLNKSSKHFSNRKDSVVQVSNSIDLFTNSEIKTYLLKVFQKDVYNWIEAIPETASKTEGERKANIRTSKALARRLASVFTSGLDKKEMTKEAIKEIKKCLEKLLQLKSERMQVKEINESTKKLENTVTNTANAMLRKIDSREKIIWDWIQDIPFFSQDDAPGKQKKVKELSKLLLDIQNKDVSDDILKVKMQNEIDRWLKELSNKDKNLDINVKHMLITKLVEDSKSVFEQSLTNITNNSNYLKSSGVYTESIYKRSIGQVTEVFHIEEPTDRDGGQNVKEVSKEIDENTKDKIFSLITNNLEMIEIPEEREIVKKQIVQILKKDAKLNDDEALDLAESILSHAQEIAKDNETDEKQLMAILRQEIRLIMGDFSINKDNWDTVEAFIMDLEIKKLFEGKSYDDTKEELLELLKEKGGLSDAEAVEMLNRLGGNFDHLLHSRAISRSIQRVKSGMLRGHSGLSLKQELNFEDQATDIIDDFFDSHVNNPTPKKQQHIDKVTKELVSNLTDIVDEPDVDSDVQTNQMRKELNKQIRRVSLDTKESVTGLAEKVLDDIQSVLNLLGKSGSRLIKEIKKYENGLKTVIKSWLDNLPIDPSVLEDEKFKDNIIQDLTGSIVDREKELAENPNISTSEIKERENLKRTCQIWMKKFLENDDLKTALSRTDDLVNAIRSVPVPDMKVTLTYIDALQKEVLAWVADQRPRVNPTVDDATLKKHIQDLSKKIQKHKGKPDAEEKIYPEIANFLADVYENLGDDELKELEESLFNTLMEKGFTDDTWTPGGVSATGMDPKKPTYIDALQKEVSVWVAAQRPHVNPTVNDATLKKHIQDLSKKIQKHKGKPDAEEKICPEIANFLADVYEDLDDDKLKALEESLFNTLMEKGFTDDTWTPGGVSATGMDPKKPTYIDALQKEVSVWVAAQRPHVNPTVNDATLKKHIQDLSKKIQMHKGKPDAEEKICPEIAIFLADVYEDLDDDKLKALEESLFDILMKKGFTDDTWTPTQDTGEFVEENLIGAVLDWLKQTPMYIKASPKEKERMEKASIEAAKGIKRAMSVARLTPGADIDEAVYNEIMKHMGNIDPANKNDEEIMSRNADRLLNFLKGQQVFQHLTGRLDTPPVNLLARAVDNWVRKLPIDTNTPQEKLRLEDEKKNFVSRLKLARNQFHPSMPEHDQACKDEAKKFLRRNITDPYKRTDEKYLEDMANQLVKSLQSVPIEPGNNSIIIKPYKNPADTLYEYIEDWIKNLPVEGETEKVNSLKQNLQSKLVNKIGELNMNSDIFDDSDLYQDLLRDELDILLAEIPGNSELNKYLPALKKDLISKIMDARQKMIEELAGKFYKQHLRDKISNSLPLPGALTLDEQASLELLKDKVADAFINLNYSGCNQSEAFKRKIVNELNRFCSDVLRHYPCTRLNLNQLKKDLHKALQRVPVPRDDSMKSEVEQVRIRECINDWMKELPLRQETATETLHRYKLAAVLAKRIHDVEMEKQYNDFIDSEPKITEEITKFIHKLLIRPDREIMIPELVQKLVYILLHTEKARRFISFDRRSSAAREGICLRYPCTLSLEDQDHLKRIKERQTSSCIKGAVQCTSLEDSSSQTDQVGQCWADEWTEQTYSPGIKLVPTLPQRKNVSCSNQTPSHFSPRILVKEYIWDSPSPGTAYPQVESRSCGAPTPMDPLQDHYYSFSKGLIDQRPNTSRPNSIQTNSQQPEQRTDPYGAYRPRPSSEAASTPKPNKLPDEKDFRNNRKPCPEEESSEEECVGAGPSQFCRNLNEEFQNNRTCGMRSPPRSSFRDNEEIYPPCWRQRRCRPHCFKIGKPKDDMRQNNCKCKDRIHISCKGPGNRYVDMCTACGISCPHPTNLFFK